MQLVIINHSFLAAKIYLKIKLTNTHCLLLSNSVMMLFEIYKNTIKKRGYQYA